MKRKKSKEENGLKAIAIVIIFALLACCVYFIYDSVIKNEFVEENTTIEYDDHLVVCTVRYNKEIDNDAKVYKPEEDGSNGFKLVKEGDMYSHYDETIYLLDGRATLESKEGNFNSKVSNIKYIYLIDPSIHGKIALLTKDGDIYYNDSLFVFGNSDLATIDKDVFNRMALIKSKNKYNEINMVLFNAKYYLEEFEGDGIPYQFIGITNNGEKDLIDCVYKEK